MPELPEVETVVRGLSSSIKGQIITDVLVKRKDLRVEVPDNFANIVKGQMIRDITRRGKYIFLVLSGGQTIIIHLGMSGSLVTYKDSDYKNSKHDHVIFAIERQNNDKVVMIFNDPRRFGLVDIVESSKVNQHKSIKILGIEPLSEEFNHNYLEKIIKNIKASIKQTIMDGNKIVGVGNIYASESLYNSKILPNRSAASLSSNECSKLVTAIKDVLTKSIEAGGSSLRDYKNSEGNKGYFQQKLSVYGRENDNCDSCSSKILKIVQGGRSSFFCPVCQK